MLSGHVSNSRCRARAGMPERLDQTENSAAADFDDGLNLQAIEDARDFSKRFANNYEKWHASSRNNKNNRICLMEGSIVAHHGGNPSSLRGSLGRCALLAICALLFGIAGSARAVDAFGNPQTIGEINQRNLANVFIAAGEWGKSRQSFNSGMETARATFFVSADDPKRSAQHKIAGEEFAQYLRAKDYFYLSHILPYGIDEGMMRIKFMGGMDRGIPEPLLPAFTNWVGSVRKALPDTVVMRVLIFDEAHLRAAVDQHAAEYLAYEKQRDAYEFRHWRLMHPPQDLARECAKLKFANDVVSGGGSSQFYDHCIDSNAHMKPEWIQSAKEQFTVEVNDWAIDESCRKKYRPVYVLVDECIHKHEPLSAEQVMEVRINCHCEWSPGPKQK
jgi:hypothetical protein